MIPQQFFSFLLQPAGSQLLRILLRLLRINQSPTHQSNSVEHSSIGVAIPSLMDSRMPGTERRCKVSWIERQSSSEIRIPLEASLTIWMGSWEAAVSSKSSCKDFSASPALMVFIAIALSAFYAFTVALRSSLFQPTAMPRSDAKKDLMAT